LRKIPLLYCSIELRCTLYCYHIKLLGGFCPPCPDNTAKSGLLLYTSLLFNTLFEGRRWKISFFVVVVAVSHLIVTDKLLPDVEDYRIINDLRIILHVSLLSVGSQNQSNQFENESFGSNRFAILSESILNNGLNNLDHFLIP